MSYHPFKILEKSFYKKDFPNNLLDGLLVTLDHKVGKANAETYFKNCGALLGAFEIAFERMKKNGADENSIFVATFNLYPRTGTQDAMLAVKFRAVNQLPFGIVEEIPEVCFHITERNLHLVDKELETNNG